MDVTLPESVNGELERYEGMVVRIVSPMTVAQNYFLGRYGQLTLSANGRIEKATNRFPAGSPEAIALADENQRLRQVDAGCLAVARSRRHIRQTDQGDDHAAPIVDLPLQRQALL